MARSGGVQVDCDKAGPVRVLVVEDEELLARQLAATLEDAGYAVDCAADGDREQNERKPNVI